MISVWLVSIIKLGIEENQLRIMVLLRDLGPEDIPDFIQWVTYIDIGKEKDYIDRLMEIVQGLINKNINSVFPWVPFFFYSWVLRRIHNIEQNKGYTIFFREMKVILRALKVLVPAVYMGN